jgi:hypothetical protein
MRAKVKILVGLSLILVCLIVSDYITTFYALQLPHLGEGNPNSKYIIDESGISGLALANIGLIILSFLLSVIYVKVSNSLTVKSIKEPNSKRQNNRFDWFIYFVCLGIVIIVIIQRVFIISNNIYWISVFS